MRSLGTALQRIPATLSWAAPTAWAALIWFLSSRAGRESGGRSGSITFLGNLAHAPAFGLLTVGLLLLAPRRASWVRLDRGVGWLVWGLTVAYGVVDELHQATVPGRHATPYDVASDAVGAACVLWIVGYVGAADAEESGLRRRLLAALALCVLSAAAATWLALILPL